MEAIVIRLEAIATSNKKLLVAPGITTRSMKLLVAPGLTTKEQEATDSKKLLGGGHRY